MELRFLGASGVEVSTLELATRMVDACLDAGVNLFDTANSYSAGRSEALLGAALGRRRDDVLISTKVHARTGDGPNDVGQSRWNLVRACEASLRRLATDARGVSVAQDTVSAIPWRDPHWFQRQFTAERFRRDGTLPDTAHAYDA